MYCKSIAYDHDFYYLEDFVIFCKYVFRSIFGVFKNGLRFRDIAELLNILGGTNDNFSSVFRTQTEVGHGSTHQQSHCWESRDRQICRLTATQPSQTPCPSHRKSSNLAQTSPGAVPSACVGRRDAGVPCTKSLCQGEMVPKFPSVGGLLPLLHTSSYPTP